MGRRLPLFAGDALADPLTGVQAALAAAEPLERGVGCLLDVSMHHTARAAALRARATPTIRADVRPPQARFVFGTAAAIGEPTRDVLSRFGL